MLLLDLFLLRPSPYRHAGEHPRATLWVSIFLVATGFLYGVLLSVFQKEAGGAMQGVPVADIPISILLIGNILSGIVITIAVHVGITLVAWLAAKGIGGPGLLVGIYRCTAYLLPLGWLVLPAVAYREAAKVGQDAPIVLSSVFLPLAVLGLAMFLAGLFHVFQYTQGKGPTRSALAVGIFAVFSFAGFAVFGLA